MALGERHDPYLNFRFQVEIDGMIEATFSEASGLDIEIETEDYQEGGVNDYIHKLPKRCKYQNLVLKRGFTDSDVLWEWHQDAVKGKISRKSGRIILLGSEGEEVWRWLFEDAYPVKWGGPDFKADGNGVAIETLELVHKGITKGCRQPMNELGAYHKILISSAPFRFLFLLKTTKVVPTFGIFSQDFLDNILNRYQTTFSFLKIPPPRLALQFQKPFQEKNAPSRQPSHKGVVFSVFSVARP